jgi:hypothetical protein
MKQWVLNPWRSWGTAAGYGAAVGFLSTLLYGTVVTLYIILRASAQILEVPSPAEGLLGTLVANAFSIVWPCLVTTLLLGLLAAIIETTAFLIIYGLSLMLNGWRLPSQGAAIGFMVAGSLAFLVNFLVMRGIGAYWGAFWPQGYLFWLGLPSLIFIGTTTWLCWQQEVDRVSQRAKLRQAMTGQ